MAAPTYTTNLATIVLCESGDTYEEFNGYALGDNADEETDWYLQGNSCASDEANNKTGVGHSIGYDYGSDLSGSFSTNYAVLAWMMCMAPNAVNTYANGGYRMLIGATTSNFDGWVVGGSDFARNPYGGWVNVVVDPDETADYTGGTGSGGTWQHFAVAFNMSSGVQKGRPLCMDAMRYGRGDLVVEFGDLGNGYATFAGMAAANDGSTARWGLFQDLNGSYLYKGLMTLGTATNAVDMRDATGVAITIDDTPKVASGWNAIEVDNASSNIEWTGVSFTAAGTQSKGTFSMAAAATIDWQQCAFKGMNTFTFTGANVTANACTFDGCAQVDGGSSAVDFQNTRVLASTVAADDSAFVWGPTTDTDGYLDGMTFSKGTNAHHAIEFGNSTASTYNLYNIAVGTDFSSTDAQNNSTFYVAATTGTVTINVFNGTGNFSYKTAGATVVLNVNNVSITVTAKDASALTNVQGARVLLLAGTGGSLPYNTSVSITRSGSTATVTHASHPFETGDKVQIDGASQQEYNCVATVTYISATQYSYTVTGTPVTPATGSPNATAVLLDGTTDSNGEISTTFAYTTDQPVEGRVRRGTASPRYKTAPLVGSITVNGFDQTSFLVSDE